MNVEIVVEKNEIRAQVGRDRSAFTFEPQRSGGRAGGQAHRFREREARGPDHGRDAVDHPNRASGQGRPVGGDGHAFDHAGGDVAEKKFHAVREARAGRGVGDEGDAIRPLGAPQHPQERGGDVETVGDDFAKDRRVREGGLEQAGDAKRAAPSRGRHAIERVRDLPHAGGEGALGILVPGVAVAAAHADARGDELRDQASHPGKLGRERDLGDDVGVADPMVDVVRRGHAEKFRPVRAAFFRRKIRAFHVHAGEAGAGHAGRGAPVPHGVERAADVVPGGADRGQRERRGAAGRVMATDRFERFGRGVHGVPAEGAVGVQVDESGRNEESARVEAAVAGDGGEPRADGGDGAIPHAQFRGLDAAVRQAEPPVDEVEIHRDKRSAAGIKPMPSA